MRRFALALAVWLVLVVATPASADVTVSTSDDDFLVNGSPVNDGQPAEGALMNFRAVMATVEDYNTSTRKFWAYPGAAWSAERNVTEFISYLDDYAATGLDMVSISLQAGHPRHGCKSEAVLGRNFSAFTSNGDLRADAADRVRRVIAAADAQGLVVSVQYFYQAEDDALASNAAVLNAIGNATRFLMGLPNDNILIEVVNESSKRNFKHDVLWPTALAARIADVHRIWPGALVSASFPATSEFWLGNNTFQAAVDWVSIHGNAITASELAANLTKALNDTQLNGTPLVVTEDKWDAGASLNVSVNKGVGWGFYEQGCEYAGSYAPGSPARYRDGFQSPPVNWSPESTSGKRGFFDAVSSVT